MSTICNVSTRYESTRFPGKVITPILGKPMCIWVAEACEKAVGRENVYISYDDDRIKNALYVYGYKLIWTPSYLRNCTERAAYICDEHKADYIIDVQSDEPCVTADMIKAVDLALISSQTTIQAISEANVVNENIIKVVVDDNGNLIYASRANVPYGEGNYLRQMCIYGFTRHVLMREYGRDSQESELEKRERVHILRLVSKGYKVKTIMVDGNTHPVDVPEDVPIAEMILCSRS